MLGEVEEFERAFEARARAALEAWDLERVESVVLTPVAAERDAAAGSVLLVADWCRPAVAEDQPVLPNPWDDRDAVDLYERYAWDVGRRLLAEWTAVLNDATGTRHDVDYWDLLLSPWLMDAVSVTIDRRLLCATAARIVPGARFLVGSPLPVPPTFADASAAFMSDDGNLGVMALIVETLGLPSAPTPSAPAPRDPTPRDPAPRDPTPRDPAPRDPAPRGPAPLRRLRSSPRQVAASAGLAAVRAALGGRVGRRVTLLGNCQLTPGQALALTARVPGARLGAPARVVRRVLVALLRCTRHRGPPAAG